MRSLPKNGPRANEMGARKLDDLRRSIQLDISQAFSKSFEEAETVKEILRSIVTQLDWCVGIAWKVRDSKTGRVRVSSSYGQAGSPEIEEFARRLNGIEAERCLVGVDGTFKDKSFWVRKHGERAKLEWISDAQALGLKRITSFPIIVSGETDYIFELLSRDNGLKGPLEEAHIILASDVRESIESFFAKKRIENDLLLAKEETEEANRIQTEYFATISHEIRTPLSGIIGMASMLLEKETDEAKLEMAGSIMSSGEAVISIIDDILTFSKGEASGLDIQRKVFSLDEVVDEVVDLIYHTARKKGLSMTAVIRSDVPETVFGDPGRFRQILLNLLGNALKFTDRGGVKLVVSCGGETFEGDRGLTVEIADTGVGIDDDEQPHLFTPFYQVDSASKRRRGGVGLGLAISQRFAELMGGKISVESLLGQGSTFTFTMPFGSNAVQDREEFFRQCQELRILIVDEIDPSRRATKMVLDGFDKRPVVVATEEEALHELSGIESEWDVLIISSPLFGDRIKEQLADLETASRRPRVIALESLSDLESFPANFSLVDSVIFRPLKRSQLRKALLGTPDKRFTVASMGTISDSDTMRSLSALVVEDDEVNAQVAMMYLEKLKVDCIRVENGRLAIDAFEAGGYDIVIMDCRIPLLDGYEVSRHIRKIESKDSWSRPPVHIIAVTANVVSGERSRCLAAGMNDYLAKPIRMSELDEIVTSVEANNSGDQEVETSSVSSQETANESIAELVDKLDAKAASRLIETWLSQVPRQIKEIEQLGKAGDEQSLRLVAHTLKGSATLLGLDTFADQCSEFERLFGEGDREGQFSLLPHFLSSYQHAKLHLRRELQRLKENQDHGYPDQRFF